jgi:collagenase-like PrtC family protease
MKITNLIALPFGLVADAVTLGEAGVTRRIFNDERNEREIEAIRAIAEALKAKGDK